MVGKQEGGRTRNSSTTSALYTLRHCDGGDSMRSLSVPNTTAQSSAVLVCSTISFSNPPCGPLERCVAGTCEIIGESALCL